MAHFVTVLFPNEGIFVVAAQFAVPVCQVTYYTGDFVQEIAKYCTKIKKILLFVQIKLSICAKMKHNFPNLFIKYFYFNIDLNKFLTQI